MQKIRFTNADSAYRVANKRMLVAFVENLFSAEGKELLSLDYILCSDEYLLQINRTYLKHDFYTDIITFDLSDRSFSGIAGEVYISIDRVKDNAVNEHVTFRNELLRVIFHGALHLCGYKDKKKSEITVMRDKEDYYLRLFESK